MPSVRDYPFQWFWDSCFHAIVWSRFDPERAAAELRGLLAVQEPDGLIPHVVFWKGDLVSRLQWHHLESRTAGRIPFHRTPHTTAQIQPPVLAQAVERVVDAGADGFLAERSHLERYYRHLAARSRRGRPDLDRLAVRAGSISARSTTRQSACAVRRRRRSSRERGSRSSEQARRTTTSGGSSADYPHHLEDVLVNAVYGQGLRALARLAARAGHDAIARWASRTADRVTEALLERCWDERLGLFVNLAGPDERRSRVKTIHGLMPLVLPDLPPEIVGRLVRHLDDPQTFGAPGLCRRSRWTSRPSSATTACAASASSGAGRSR